ncbi:hypothetical protein FHS91_002575 [Sphingobium xanthum]|jgi:hypothetical protein
MVWLVGKSVLFFCEPNLHWIMVTVASQESAASALSLLPKRR